MDGLLFKRMSLGVLYCPTAPVRKREPKDFPAQGRKKRPNKQKKTQSKPTKTKPTNEINKTPQNP